MHFTLGALTLPLFPPPPPSCVYAAYLFVSAVKRSTRVVLAARIEGDHRAALSRAGTNHPLAARLEAKHVSSTLGALLRGLASVPALLDWAAVGSLGATIVTWLVHLKALSAFNAQLSLLPRTWPSAVDGATVNDDWARYDYYSDSPAWLPGPGSTPAFAPAWAGVEAHAAAAAAALHDWEVAAQVALIFLAARVFKYLSFQAHLGVLVTTMSTAARDLSHFMVGFFILGGAYCAWGVFAFGHGALAWTPRYVVRTLFFFIMYDYTYVDMAAGDTGSGGYLSAVFYASFMVLITNIVMWLFFASLFDCYSAARLKAQEWPTLLQETRAFLAAVPHMLPPWLAVVLPPPTADYSCCSARGCRRAGAALGRARAAASCVNGRKVAVTQLPPRDFFTWGELISAGEGAALSGLERVSAADIARALNTTRAAASLTIADLVGAAAGARALRTCLRVGGVAPRGASVAAGFYGFGLPGGPRLPAGGAKSLREALPAFNPANAPGVKYHAQKAASDPHIAEFPTFSQALLSSSNHKKSQQTINVATALPSLTTIGDFVEPPENETRPPTPATPSLRPNERPSEAGGEAAALVGAPPSPRLGAEPLRVTVNPMNLYRGGAEGADAPVAPAHGTDFAAFDSYRSPAVGEYDQDEFAGTPLPPILDVLESNRNSLLQATARADLASSAPLQLHPDEIEEAFRRHAELYYARFGHRSDYHRDEEHPW